MLSWNPHLPVFLEPTLGRAVQLGPSTESSCALLRGHSIVSVHPAVCICVGEEPRQPGQVYSRASEARLQPRERSSMPMELAVLEHAA